jgi:adenylate kinase
MAKKILNLIILGSAGSGKGTQANLLAQKFGLEIIETGELVRKAEKENTPTGKLIFQMDNIGMHLSDDLIFNLFQSVFKKIKKDQGFLIDGYPRTAGQAWDLSRLLIPRKNQLIYAIYFKVSEKEALQRLLNRAVCLNCKKILSSRKIKKCPNCGGMVKIRDYDKDEKSIKKRITWFWERVIPAVEFYRQKGILIEVDGAGSIEKVFKDTAKKISIKMKK